MTEWPLQFLNTVLLRPYVFIFLGAFLLMAHRLWGWRRTGAFFLISWITAFVCEFSSTRIGIPFGFYYYTGSTVGQELYLANVPFMDSLSFTFLLYASYCLALVFVLPSNPRSNEHSLHLTLDPCVRTSGPVLVLTALFLTFIDVVIDPVALRGDRWFLGLIYGYPAPGLYFGIPLANFVGWAIVGLIALSVYNLLDRRLPPFSRPVATDGVTTDLLLGVALYYGVLIFNLVMTFWIGEFLLGLAGIMIYTPVSVLLLLRLRNRLPYPERSAAPVRLSEKASKADS